MKVSKTHVIVTRSPGLAPNPVFHEFNTSQRRPGCGVPMYEQRDVIMPTHYVATMGLFRPCKRCFPNTPAPAVVGPRGRRTHD